MPKAQAIAAIYFPQFVKDIAELDIAAGAYEMWMFEGAQKRLLGNIAELSEGSVEAYRPYMHKRADTLRKLSEFAASEFSE